MTPTLNLFLLSNLTAAETGIAGTVTWISAGEFAPADEHHGPRIAVVVGDNLRAETLVVP